MSAQYGLIGKSLVHSFSQQYFTKKFGEGSIDAVYQNLELASIEEFIPLKQQFQGFNVTIPYKTAIIPYLDELSLNAQEIGAVNCIEVKAGRLIGHNTDIIGFKNSLQPLLLNLNYECLILGNGGAAKAVKVALKQLNIPSKTVGRNPKKTDLLYSDLDEKIISRHLLLINTTPLGTFPNVSEKPEIPYDELSEQHILFDLVYNPAETAFLLEGKKKGAQIKNGYEMLILQAEAAWKIWLKNH